MPYLSRRALKGLANYKYVASGYTWLDDVHTPAWNGAFVGGVEEAGTARRQIHRSDVVRNAFLPPFLFW